MTFDPPVGSAAEAGLVRSLRGSELLLGAQGGSMADVDALQDLLLRVARIGEDLPEVAEVLLDPVLVAGVAGAPV